MTDQQRKWIEELARCSFYPGSYDKRFVRDMESQPADAVLTEKQAAFLHRLAWRYRKQRGDYKMQRPADPFRAGENPRAIASELERLAAWNEGKAIK